MELKDTKPMEHKMGEEEDSSNKISFYLCLVQEYEKENPYIWYAIHPEEEEEEEEEEKKPSTLSPVLPHMPFIGRGMGCCALGSKIYAVDGVLYEYSFETFRKKVTRNPGLFAYDTESPNPKWNREDEGEGKGIAARAYSKLAAIDAKIYVFGSSLSYDYADPPDPPYPWSQVFDPQKRTSSTLEDPPPVHTAREDKGYPCATSLVTLDNNKIALYIVPNQFIYDLHTMSWKNFEFPLLNDNKFQTPVVVGQVAYAVDNYGKLYSCNLHHKHPTVLLIPGLEDHTESIKFINRYDFYNQIDSFLFHSGNKKFYLLWSYDDANQDLTHTRIPNQLIHCLKFHLVEDQTGTVNALPDKCYRYLARGRISIECLKFNRKVPPVAQKHKKTPEALSPAKADVASRATLVYDNSKLKAIPPPGSSQDPVVRTTPSYSSGSVSPLLVPPPQVGITFSPIYAPGAGTSSNGNDTVFSPQLPHEFQSWNPFVLSTAGPSPHMTQAAETFHSSLTGTQQLNPVYGQPYPHYPPNFLPYCNYTFYPTPQLLARNTVFSYQRPLGSIYQPVLESAPGVGYSLYQYKPVTNPDNSTHVGTSTGYDFYNSSPAGHSPNPAISTGNSFGNEDLSASQLKENNVCIPGVQWEL